MSRYTGSTCLHWDAPNRTNCTFSIEQNYFCKFCVQSKHIYTNYCYGTVCTVKFKVLKKNNIQLLTKT